MNSILGRWRQSLCNSPPLLILNSNPVASLKQDVIGPAQQEEGSLEVAGEKILWGSLPSGWKRVWEQREESWEGDLNRGDRPRLPASKCLAYIDLCTAWGTVSIENISEPIFPFCSKRNDLNFENFLNPAEDYLKFGPIPLCPLCPVVSLT